MSAVIIMYCSCVAGKLEVVAAWAATEWRNEAEADSNPSGTISLKKKTQTASSPHDHEWIDGSKWAADFTPAVW